MAGNSPAVEAGARGLPTLAIDIGLSREFDLQTKWWGRIGAARLWIFHVAARWNQPFAKFVGNTFTIQQVYGGQTFHLHQCG